MSFKFVKKEGGERTFSLFYKNPNKDTVERGYKVGTRHKVAGSRNHVHFLYRA